MFTGIVQQLGEVAAVTPCDSGKTLHIDPCGWETQPRQGDSVAVNGCCLTVTRCDGEEKGTDLFSGSRKINLSPLRLLRFDVIHQTLQTTALGGLSVGDPVNLEPAVTAATLMSGHLVQGHVDGVGRVRTVSTETGEHLVRIEPPAALMECVVDKGSIAVDGVSLTVALCGDTWFEVALIPATIEQTNLGGLRESRQVNIEVDYVAKIVVSWLRKRGQIYFPAVGK